MEEGGVVANWVNPLSSWRSYFAALTALVVIDILLDLHGPAVVIVAVGVWTICAMWERAWQR